MTKADHDATLAVDFAARTPRMEPRGSLIRPYESGEGRCRFEEASDVYR